MIRHFSEGKTENKMKNTVFIYKQMEKKLHSPWQATDKVS